MTSGVVIFPDPNSMVIMGTQKPWDQPAVNQLAAEFAASIDNLRQSVRGDARELAKPAQTARAEVLERLDDYEEAAEHLAAEPAAGKDRAATRPALLRVHRARRDLILAARGWPPPPETMRRVVQSASLFAQIDAYYVEPRSR